MSSASLQHQGDNALAAVRTFGALDLRALEAADEVHFTLPGTGLVAYSRGAALGLVAAAAAGLGGLLHVGVRRGRWTWRGVAGGALRFTLDWLRICVGVTLAVAAAGLLLPWSWPLPLRGPWANGAWAFGLLDLALLLLAASHRRRRRLPVATASAGALAALLLGAALATWLLDGASYLLLWPLLGGLLPLAGMALGRCRCGALATFLGALGAVPAVWVLGPAVHLVAMAMSRRAITAALAPLLIATPLAAVLLPVLSGSAATTQGDGAPTAAS